MAIEYWPRIVVVAAYDELRADPSQVISVDDMRAYLADIHASWTATSDA